MKALVTTTDPSQLDMDTEHVDRQLLSSLENLAVSLKPEVITKPKNRSSRFWFDMETTAQYVESQKETLKTKTIEHVDQEVVDRVALYKDELSPSLKEKIAKIREFFLLEIAPLTLAASGGTTQARDVAQRTLGIEIDSAMFGRFETMVNKAATLRLSKFVASLFSLPEESASALIGSFQQQPSTLDPQLQSIMSELKSMTAVETRKEVKALKASMAKIERAMHEKG